VIRFGNLRNISKVSVLWQWLVHCTVPDTGLATTVTCSECLLDKSRYQCFLPGNYGESHVLGDVGNPAGLQSLRISVPDSDVMCRLYLSQEHLIRVSSIFMQQFILLRNHQNMYTLYAVDRRDVDLLIE
jgi:hypothetical protein